MSQATETPLCLEDLSDEQLAAELEKGIADIKAGRMRPASDVFADMNKLYDITPE